jgi:hypothetical protein
MADNLVDNMISEMNANNSPHVLNYNPSSMGAGQPMGTPQLSHAPQMMMGGGQQQMMAPGPQYGYNPVQPNQQVQMGEVQYIPQSQQQAPTMQNGMEANMDGEEMAPSDEDEQMMMDAPDLSNYGMEDDGAGFMDNLINQSKGPLIVVVLAFLMSMPQVSGAVRNFVARFTTNPMYVNVALALLMGAIFYTANMVL